MSQWFYLSLSFALFFTFFREEKRSSLDFGFLRELALDSFYLTGAVASLFLLHSLFTFFLWAPAARKDLGLLSLFLLARLLDEGIGRLGRGRKKSKKTALGVSPSYLALAGFSLWILETGGGGGRFLWGLALPWAAALFQALLGGLRERVRLSNLPPPLEGAPILFWLAMLLALAFPICHL